MKTSQQIFLHAGKLSCSANNHHNCRHRIIIPLNTRTFDNYTSRLTPLHRSDNPLSKTRTNLLPRSRGIKNQYAYPDAPKPIHPDKEHFCPRTIQLGANIQLSSCRPLQERQPKNRNSIFPITFKSHHQTQPGGDGRNRTDDPLLAKQVLYQLSYIPHS